MMNAKILFSVVLIVAVTTNIVSSGLLEKIKLEDEDSNVVLPSSYHKSPELFMQERDLAETYVELNGTLYYFENNLVANWYAANDFCRKLGLFLVSIETQEENEILIDYISTIACSCDEVRLHVIFNNVRLLGVTPQLVVETFNHGPSDYWTSLTDLAANNTYTWFTTGERALYFDWHTLEPDHGAAGTERCVSIAYAENLLKWALNDPTDALHIICEQFPDPNTPTTVSTTTRRTTTMKP